MKDTKPSAQGIGGKARNLMELDKLGIPVPSWMVIPEEQLLTIIAGENHPEEIRKRIDESEFSSDIRNQITAHFGENCVSKRYAVRSSAVDEDGDQHSFAGQFDTFLNVPFDKIGEAVKNCWKSACSERVIHYRKENNIPLRFGIGVIIQEMLDPDVSGVAFGIDPVSGDKETYVISSVFGLGEGIVSGELDADVYTVKNQVVSSRLAKKTHAFRNKPSGGTIETEIPEGQQNSSTLSNDQIVEISKILNILEGHYKKPQDIEFAVKDGRIYLLQTRPVTATGNSIKGEYILWDNSNIIESYPGITTPLTFSFILKMYERVYRQFVELLGVNQKEIEKHSTVFANTLGLVRGRVYYNLLSWYKMLAMLPGYSINAEFMENMMGVKERFELKEDHKMSKGLARFRILMMLFKMIRLQFGLPRERRRFMKHLNKVMNQYGAYDFRDMEVAQIVSRYKQFESNLLLEWKAPLINDFFAMIWFGLLQKNTAKLCPDEPNLHNDLLCGSQDIISVEPIHRSMALADAIRKDPACESLFRDNSPEEIWKKLSNGSFPQIKNLFDDYINRFGNRCVGELKLETISYQHDPSLFVKVIRSYVVQDIRLNTDHKVENTLRENAEIKIRSALKGKLLKKWWFNFTLKKARDLVSNRENLRYERTRGFGMVRTMFRALGEVLHKTGKLTAPEDIFYLHLDEILTMDTGAFKPEWVELIEQRKKEFDTYRSQPDPEERFFTYGMNFSDEFIYSKDKIVPVEGDLKGIGCCPGRVQAKVRLVKHPDEIESLNGDILVTSSTDPGWVTLFPSASAIIVERGSLLSHSAIVSREMGIPCIVGVSGLLRTLKTGDEVLMDGSTGEIKILNNV